jgi:hypothetical protein
MIFAVHAVDVALTVAMSLISVYQKAVVSEPPVNTVVE